MNEQLDSISKCCLNQIQQEQSEVILRKPYI